VADNKLSTDSVFSVASYTDTSVPQDNWAVEFGRSAWDSAVTKKVNGVRQLFGAEISTNPEPQREGMQQLAHVAGSAAGDILDFVILSKLAGKGIGAITSRFAGRSAAMSFLAESAVARNAANGALVGFANGSILTPTKEGESGFQRLGNGLTEAGTFATLGGMSSKYADALSQGFLSRVRANAVSGGTAGLVHSQLHAWTHGRTAGVEETLMNTAGWAVGNVAFGEGAHWFGKGLQHARQAMQTSEQPLVAQARAVQGRQESVETPVSREATGRPESRGGATETAAAPVEVKGQPTEPTARLERQPKVRPFQLEKTETVSMRELAQNNDPRFDEIMEAYHKQLRRTFPLEGEIESAATYSEYLRNPHSTWDMVVLRDKAQNIIGGIQYQIVDVGGQSINKAAWGEHIWLAPEARNYQNFHGLVKIAEERITKAGGDMVFMEFNNPEKMTPAQILEDAAAGISPADREKIWGRVGIHVPVDRVGRMPEYGQPSMDGQPPVDFLSLGFIGSKPITGKTISADDYLKLATAAHSTIPGVDVATDPTIKAYTDAVRAMDDTAFTFVPLAAIARAREAALNARVQSMSQSIIDAIAKSLAGDIDVTLSAAARQSAGNTPDSLKGQLPEALSRALRERIVQALKQANGG
jgi:hypothetical protein